MSPSARWGFTLALLAAVTASSQPRPAWPQLTTPPAAVGGGENDAALVVGIERYGEVAAIPGARQNAEDWYSFFTTTLRMPPDSVTLLRDKEGTVEKISRFATEAARAVKPGGTLWVVFIGHGAPAKDGTDGVLVGYDAQQDADSLYARSLPQSALLAAATAGPQARTVLVLDTCFSGRTGSGQALVAGLQPVIALKPKPRTMQTTVLTAARADQFAGPLPGANRPAFSYLLLGGLRGWADQDHDGAVTLPEAFGYTETALRTLVKDRVQTPEWSGEAPSLAVRAAEGGPNLSAMVLTMTANVGASELAFGSSTSIQVPKFEFTPAKGLSQVNLQAERGLEFAIDAEENKRAAPEDKARAWCALAQLTPNNPYADQAGKACHGWLAYAGALRNQRAGLIEHYHTLGGYLQLKRKAPEQKLAAIDAFLSSYGSLNTDARVALVFGARASVVGGAEAQLPDEVARLDDACRRNDTEACVHLGAMYAKGTWPLLKDPQRATQLLLNACEYGSALGCRFLGESTEAGLGEAPQPQRAFAYFQRACEMGEGAGCTRQGLLLSSGKGTLPDQPRAAALEERGCDLGDASGCLALSGMVAAGRGRAQDATLAATLRKRACELGDARGCGEPPAGEAPVATVETPAENPGAEPAPATGGDTRTKDLGWAWVAGGGAGVLLLTGVITGGLAAGQAERARNTPQVNVGTYQESVAAGRGLAAVADLSFVLGLGCGAASAWLFLTGGTAAAAPSAPPTVLAAPVPGGGVVVLGGSF